MNELLKDVIFNRLIVEEFVWCALVSFILCAICCMLQVLFTERKKYISHYLLTEYVFLVLCLTVICRKKGELEQFFPIPFYDYGSQEFGIFGAEMLMNVLMFVPVGLLFSLSFRSLRWQHVAYMGFLISVTIEFFQWILKCGSCETNDLINNSIGCLLGYYLSKFCSFKG